MPDIRFITTGLVVAAALAIAPAAASAAPSPVEDTSFAGGTTGAATWVVEPGELRLRPVAAENFDAVPAGWATPWRDGGTATAAGTLVLNGARIEAPASSPPASLEFRATFAAAPFQSAGFAEDLDDGPWAIFSTSGGATPGLFARSLAADGSAELPTQLSPTIDPLVPHTYRIDWQPAEVKYYVDGVLAATHARAITTTMRPVASDFESTGMPDEPTLKVDWAAIGAYPASGAFESRLFEADDPRAVWQTLTATASPGVTFETRTGNSAGAMSAYQQVGAGGAIQSPPGRFIQYRATFTNADQRATLVSMSYAIDASAPTTSISGSSVSGTTATVTFSSPAADVARFECSLDGGAFAACTSPATFPGLTPGSHAVAVRAVDKVGNVGAAASTTVTVATPTQGSGGSAPDRKAPKVVVVGSRTLTVGARVPLRLKCPADEASCEIAARLKRGRKNASERRTATVAGGATKKVKLRLTDKTRALLIARGRLTVQAVVVAEDAAGNVRRTTFTLTLKPR